MSPIFCAFGAFFLKHFFADFPLQFRWMYLHKHIVGHPGGLAHAGLHGIFTMIVLSILLLCGFAGPHASIFVMLRLGLFDTVAHYWIDWAKMNLNRRMGWKPDNSECFWHLLGLDQLLHYATYLIILIQWFY